MTHPTHLGALYTEPRAKLCGLDVPVHPAGLVERAHAAEHAVRIRRKVVARELVAKEVGQAVAIEQLQRHPVYTKCDDGVMLHPTQRTMAARQSGC